MVAFEARAVGFGWREDLFPRVLRVAGEHLLALVKAGGDDFVVGPEGIQILFGVFRLSKLSAAVLRLPRMSASVDRLRIIPWR